MLLNFIYFKQVNPCQHPVVILQDMKYSEVDALVKFMYQGEVNVKQEDLARFLKVAEVLKIKGLTLDKTLLQVEFIYFFPLSIFLYIEVKLIGINYFFIEFIKKQ